MVTSANAAFAQQKRLDEKHKQTNLQINRPPARRLTTLVRIFYHVAQSMQLKEYDTQLPRKIARSDTKA
jgi:hypothetical protein